MEEQYYVRRKGRVAGPYDFEVIMKMAKTGKLFKSDYVSLDQVSWSLAEDCDIIFPKPPKPPIDPPYVDPGPDPTGGPPVGVPSTNKDWHYSYGDMSDGPIKERELKQKFLTKEITTKTKVWTDGMADWEAADQVKTFKDFFDGFGPRPDIFDPPDDRLYATFMQRVGAEIIDGMVGCTISIVVYFASTFFVGLFLGFLITVLGRNVDNYTTEITVMGVLIGAVWSFISVMLYYIKPIASPKMATVGKSAMGIYVCKLDGRQLSFGVAFLRYLTKTITFGLFLGLGCLTVLFTVKKQALHDLMIESIVLQRVE